MLNLKSIVIRTYIKQELFTYFTLVPVLVYFVLFSFDFHLVSLSQFILFLSIAIITTLGSGILFKYLSYKRVMNYYNQMDKSNKNQISILKSKIFEMSTFDSQTAFIRWLVIAGSTFVSPMYIFLGAEIHELVLLIILFFSNGLVSIPIYYLISESGLIKAHKFPIFNGIEFSKDRHEIPIMIKLQSSILISVLYPVIIFSTFILYSVLDLIDLGDIFIGFIILVVASIWASLFSSYQLSKNIKVVSGSINENLSELSKFSGDLTKNIASFSNDEFGKMSEYFNKFIFSLRQMIYKIRELIDENNKNSTSLASVSEETSASLEEIMSTMDIIRNNTKNLDTELSKSNQSVHSSKESLSNIVNIISKQSNTINQSFKSIEDIHKSIGNTATIVERKLNFVIELDKTAKTSKIELNKSIEITDKVTNSTKEMLNLINVIDDIAEQTNLLAMNASIESANAGVKGKGFGIVASEIRELANNTSKRADEITNSLNTITNNIHNSKESIERTAVFFNKIIDGINDLSYDMKEIKNNMNGLNTNSEYIRKLLSELLSITEVVNSSVKDIDKKESQISSSVSNIKDISSHLYSAIEEITSGISEISNTAQFLSESGTHNAEIVQNLENLVSKFILDKDKLEITDY